MGDVDIETFPTLLVAHGGRPLFFGPVQPSAAQALAADRQPAAGRRGTVRRQPPKPAALLARLAPVLLKP